MEINDFMVERGHNINADLMNCVPVLITIEDIKNREMMIITIKYKLPVKHFTILQV